MLAYVGTCICLCAHLGEDVSVMFGVFLQHFSTLQIEAWSFMWILGDVKVTTLTCAASFYIRSHLPSWEPIFHYHNGHIQDEIGVCILLTWLKTLRFFTVLALDESFIIKLLLTQNCQDEVNAFIIVPRPFHELALFPSYLSSLLLSHHKAMSGHTICCPHYPYCSFLPRLSDGVFYWKSLNFTLFVSLISMLLLIIFFLSWVDSLISYS